MQSTGYLAWPYRDLRVCYRPELDGGGTALARAFVEFVARRATRTYAIAYEWCAGPAFIGFALLAEGRRPPDDLHYVYAITPLVVALVSEAMRATASQRELEQFDDPQALERRDRILLARRIVLREIGIMTVGLLLVTTLLLRALSSGGIGGIL